MSNKRSILFNRPLKSITKTRVLIDFMIFLLSIIVVIIARIEDRYQSVIMVIPIGISINFCLSLYRFRKYRQLTRQINN